MKPGVYKVLHKGKILLEHCEYGTSLWFRFKGLMLTKTLAPSHGLLLMPCNCVHMFFMRYALDIVYLDKNLRIIRICPNLKPWRISPIVWGAHSVLECRAGLAKEHKLDTGEVLHYEYLKNL